MRVGRLDALLLTLLVSFFLHSAINKQEEFFQRSLSGVIQERTLCEGFPVTMESRSKTIKNATDFEFNNQIPKSQKTAIAMAALMSLYTPPSLNQSLSWDEFASQLRRDPVNAMTRVENNWRYLENFCVFESNKSIVLINNTKTMPKKRYPTEFYSWYYKRYLYFRDENRTSFPESVPLFNSSYLFITRGWGGWNNIYHHTEWIHNLLRYVHHASALPRMETVMYYPDPILQNATFGDPKGHYKWSIDYYNLAKTAFPSSCLPRFFQGKDYARANMSFCARRGVELEFENYKQIIAPIVPRMYDSFVTVQEPLLIKQLVYRMFKKHIRLTKPSVLSILFLDRNGGKRGIENRDALVAFMENITGTQLVIQPNRPMSFREQVEFVWDKDIYVSVHGAAMTHILFMEPLGALIELNPPNFREPFYRNMATKTQLLYYGVFSTQTKDMKLSMSLQQTEKKLNQWFTVPMELFEETMAMAVENVWKLKYKTVHL